MHLVKNIAYVIILLLMVQWAQANAISQTDITVGLTGTESQGNQVFVGISPNTHSCLNGGIYFQEANELDKTLSLALAAKLAGKLIRIDFSQPDGAGGLCFGHGVYIQ